MADFFTASSSAAVAVKAAQQNKTGTLTISDAQISITDVPELEAPAAPCDKSESTTAVKGAGSNFSMCEIIM
ncbi:hypothetical protein RSOLAG1IB_09830 [Rhizoctonia solani AG-1 IB]|uniref:Uncharacterized protein n=1 Tax=Thanatephorus cucumeris (strain AG1-IB / isolate 7/3/14) TaxID=1108050 RepID=A0A0B7FYE6_THACB|nr:hypothetical protein RSOLAG1IB_09830 [Rhizoctonia solani AG-1 IB]